MIYVLMPAARQDARDAGARSRDEEDRFMGEAFADLLLQMLRNINGCPAMVLNHRIHLIVKDQQGTHPVSTQLKFTADPGFTGSGRLSFIPDDPLSGELKLKEGQN
jgi:hypothetical protein